jgi:hypothetical protein
MNQVLLVGFEPAMVDFSDPALPPGMTAGKIHAGVKLALDDMATRGWAAENCFITPTKLRSQTWSASWPVVATAACGIERILRARLFSLRMSDLFRNKPSFIFMPQVAG